MRTLDELAVNTSLHPKIRRMHEYWLARRGARLMPSRADIDPVELREPVHRRRDRR